MKRFVFLVLTLFLLMTTVAWSESKDLKQTMKDVFITFSELHPYLINIEEFQNEKNHDRILKLIKSLDSSFHSAETVPSIYKDKPGFLAMMSMMDGAIEDSLDSFKQGEKKWAAWRLKAASGTCVNCHSSFGVDVRYQHSDSYTNLSDYEKAEIHLISRQIQKAKDEFYNLALKSAKNEDQHYLMTEAARRLVVIYTRFDLNPVEASTRLKAIIQAGDLSEYATSIFNEWIKSFNSWSKEKDPKVVSFAKAEQLTKEAFSENPLASDLGSVELLRSSGILHQLFINQKLSKSEKPKALFLLGAIYSKLPLFIINEMPQFYLELCINEFPGTEYAKKSYSLYQELVEFGYTGSSGEHLPAIVKQELKDLRDTAYGVKKFKSQI
ncbi:MAG: hypothetical protein R3A13_01930 [Bdellovibrionota bacterium]